MTVTIIVPGPLRADVDGATTLLVAAGTLGTVLDEVTSRWPRLGRRICDERGQVRRYINVYLDGEDIRALNGRDTQVTDAAEIHVLPSVAGG